MKLKVARAKTRASAIQDNASAGPWTLGLGPATAALGLGLGHWAWALGGPWAWPLGLGLGLWPWAVAVGLGLGPGLVDGLWRCGMRVQKSKVLQKPIGVCPVVGVYRRRSGV